MRCVALAASIAFAPSARADEEEVVLHELEQNGHVVRDGKGVLHVFASTEHDLLLLQGWCHAMDRLWQMDYYRRVASGTVAELIGAAGLPGDVQLRTIGLRRAAERSLLALTPATRAGLEAYAEGVNLWVQSHALPAEYGALELTQFEPWTAVDSVVISRLVTFLLSFEIDADATIQFLTYVGTGAGAGFDGAALYFEDVHRSAGFDPAATIPDAGGPPGVRGGSDGRPSIAGGGRSFDASSISRATRDLAGRWLADLERVPLMRSLLDPERRAGSNEWAISGSLTASGRPLIGNDPHLDLGAPSSFVPTHLIGAGFNVTGEGFAGVPYVVLGHNDRIAWGTTNLLVDVTDTFAEVLVPDPASPSGLSTVHQGLLEPVIPIPESYRQNEPGDGIPDNLTDVPSGPDAPPFTWIVPRRNQGPIVAFDPASGDGISIQWTGFGATRELDAIRALDRARDLQQFKDALRNWDAGSQNFVYADVDGTIAYLTCGEVPLREDLAQGLVSGLPPFFIRDGLSGNEWVVDSTPGKWKANAYELLDVDLLPHLVDPPNGWFVNANNDPTGFSRDNDPLNQLDPQGRILYLNYGFDTGFRAGRIQQLLAEKLALGPLTRADVEEMQADTVLPDAQWFVPHVIAALARAQGGGVDPVLAALGADPGVIEAVDRLGKWDFTTPTGVDEGYDASDVDGVTSPPTQAEIDASVAATLYALWRGRFLESTIDATLLQFALPVDSPSRELAGLRKLLEEWASTQGVGASGLDFFVVPGVASADDERDILILAAVRAALDLLAGPAFDAAFHQSTNQADYRWGRLHRIVFFHPLGDPFNVPPAGGAFPDPFDDLVGIPVDGGFGSVDSTPHDARGNHSDAFLFDTGPARRLACQLDADRPRGESCLPGGASGNLGDPNHVSLLPDWLTNETYTAWLTKSEVLAVSVHTWNFRAD